MGAVELADGFGDALRDELDLRIEVRNMTSVAASACHDASGVRIPVPVERMPTRRVLVMERLEGRSLSAEEPHGLPERRGALARGLLDCLLRQVMVDGTFHADPHPGNVFFSPTGSWACWTSAPLDASTPRCAAPYNVCCWPWTTAIPRH